MFDYLIFKSNKALVFAGVLALIVLTFLTQIPALHGGFIWDDVYGIVDNSLVKAANGLQLIWMSQESIDYWPLSYSLFWIEWHLWGLDTTGYHITCIILHTLNGLLIWQILKKLGFRWAFFAALLFCIHPVNVETVSWIFQQKTTLSTALALSSFFFFLCFEEKQLGFFYVISFFLFSLSLLAKTATCTWPVIMLGYLWFRNSGFSRKDFFKIAPFFIVSGLGILISLFWYHQVQPLPPSEIIRDDGIVSRFVLAGWAIWFYILKIFIPTNLMFIYPRWIPDLTSFMTYLPSLSILLIFAVGILKTSFLRHPILLSLGYFIDLLIPVLGFYPVYFMRYSYVADHWQYLAMIGFIVLFLVVFNPLTPAKKIVFVALVLLLTYMSFERSKVFVNEETLWRDSLKKNPEAWLAHNSLGLILMRKNEAEEALNHFRESLKIKTNSQAHNNIGVILLNQGNLKVAAYEFESALQLKPYAHDSRSNLGLVLFKLGRHEEALRDLHRALAGDPNARTYFRLGAVYEARNQLQDAKKYYEEASRLETDLPFYKENLSRLLKKNVRLGRSRFYLNKIDLVTSINNCLIYETKKGSF